MKLVINDPSKIKNKPVQEESRRVKMFILNSKNEFVFISAYKGIQLPGGHIEKGENPNTAIIREIQEETGIKLSKDEVPEPFLKVDKYLKRNPKTNEFSSITYYYIETDKPVNLNQRNLTELEKQNKYSVCYVNKPDLEKKLSELISFCPNLGSRKVAEEILYAYSVLKEQNKKMKKQ